MTDAPLKSKLKLTSSAIAIASCLSLINASPAKALELPTSDTVLNSYWYAQSLFYNNDIIAWDMSNYSGIDKLTHDNQNSLLNNGNMVYEGRQYGSVISLSNFSISEGIVNNGTMAADSGEGGAAISIDYLSSLNSITNTGTITGGSGISVTNNSTVTGAINNSGTITGNSNNGFLTYVGYRSVYGIAVLGTGSEISANINNAGTIIANGSDTATPYGYTYLIDKKYAISVEDGAKISGKITNTGGGIISAFSYGASTAYGINVSGSGSDISGGIYNQGGMITGTNSAIYVGDGGDISGGIHASSGYILASGTNNAITISNASVSGGIIVSGTAEISSVLDGGEGNISFGNAIYMSGLTNETAIILNGGRVIGDIYDANYNTSGKSIVSVGGNFSTEGNFSVYDFNVLSSGNITLNNGNDISISDSSTLNNSGYINTQDSSTNTISGNIDNSSTGKLTTGISSVLNINGSLINNGTLEIGQASSLRMNGNISGSGIYKFNVGNDTSGILDSGDIGQISFQIMKGLGGSATAVLNNSTFYFNVTSSTVSTGNSYTILLANGYTISGTPTVIDNSSKYNFTLSYSGDDLVVTAVDAPSGITVIPTKSNYQAVATQLQNILDTVATPDTGLQQIIDQATSASTPEELDSLISKTIVDPSNSVFMGTRSVSDNTAIITVNRLGAIRSSDTEIASNSNSSSGVSAGNSLDLTRTAWVQTFGQLAKQGDRQGFLGYDSSTYGIVYGMDSKEIIKGVTLGAAISYGKTSVDSKDSNNTQTDTQTYQISLYGEKELDNLTRIDGIIGYSFNNTDMSIYDIGGVSGLNASGNFSGRQFSAQTQVSRDYEGPNNIKLTPNLSANYIYFDSTHYQETGAGGANQTVANSAMQAFELGIGAEVSKNIPLNKCECNCASEWFKPMASFNIKHDFIGDKVEADSQFIGGGSSFKTYGFTPAQTSYDVGIGFKRYSTSNNWEITGKYDFEYKQDYYSQSASLRVGYKF